MKSIINSVILYAPVVREYILGQEEVHEGHTVKVSSIAYTSIKELGSQTGIRIGYENGEFEEYFNIPFRTFCVHLSDDTKITPPQLD